MCLNLFREMVPMWTDENKEAFLALVEPLLQQQEVQDMRTISQHAAGISCYDHSVFVSYLSFLMARRLGLDYRAAARGGAAARFTFVRLGKDRYRQNSPPIFTPEACRTKCRKAGHQQAGKRHYCQTHVAADPCPADAPRKLYCQPCG